ncbi:MAG TPA: DNA repair protein RecN, partial [Rhodospirillaceae bacterium]|nr:DNA repair protein RecN [Rhodospirillaceae bacterium]
MLTSLSIKNVVLIEQLTIEFKGGFCALTGETGAGKSILLDSLGLALGARSESSLVRKGSEQAQVSAVFEIEKSHSAFALLQAADIQPDTTLILRRAVGSDGRSKAYINDQPVSIGLLREVGDTLVEIHGQFATQGLLDPKTHRALLDEYAGVDIEALEKSWGGWKAAAAALTEGQERARKTIAEEEYLRAALDTLEELDPKEGEEEKLASLRERLMKREHILENLNVAHEGVEAAEGALGGAFRALEKAGAGEALVALDRSLVEMKEVAAQIQSLSADLEESEFDLPQIDDRLFAIRGLARKHNILPDELPKLRGDLAAQLSLIGRQEETLGDLRKKADDAKKLFIEEAERAGAARRKGAEKLDKLVEKELPPLKLEKAKFVTEIVALAESEWGPYGMDRVRFLVSTNPGAAPGPLNKIASGGEMARFMLALKVVMAQTGAAGTLIFDEVDSGIGGGTADAVGERLARLAKGRQVLVVTHAPQVAARAGNHWIVLKDGTKDMRTTVVPLDEVAERREEIARMLA